MPPVWEISKTYVVNLRDFLGNPLFWLVLALIAFQYRKSEKLERAFFGQARQPLLGRVLISTFFGIIGGLIGSLLLMGIGVSISFKWTRYVLLLSLVLAFIDMRFICFAYSGGLLSIISLVFGWPPLDVASLLALVAVLHAVESILMLLSGHVNSFPVTVRQPSGRLIGGYSLQMFWPLPLLALVFVPELAQETMGGGIAMPHWWPLIRPAGAENLADLTLYMVPILAGLGYGELAITMTPKQKARRSAVGLLGYSAVLLGLAWLGSRYPVFLPLGAIFAPLGHELLIVVANQREQAGEPLFAHDGPGLMVMEVLPGGLAQKAGLRPGDIITTANGEPVDTIAQLRAIVQAEPQVVLAVSRRGFLSHVALALPIDEGQQQLGILMVPDSTSSAYVETRFNSPLQKLLQKWWWS